MSDRIGASATVQLIVEVSGLGSWAPGCTIDQVHNQAKAVSIYNVNIL